MDFNNGAKYGICFRQKVVSAVPTIYKKSWDGLRTLLDVDLGSIHKATVPRYVNNEKHHFANSLAL